MQAPRMSFMTQQTQGDSPESSSINKHGCFYANSPSNVSGAVWERSLSSFGMTVHTSLVIASGARNLPLSGNRATFKLNHYQMLLKIYVS